MTRLVLEGTHPLTRIEVMDWLSSVGFTTYDVEPMPMPEGVTEAGKNNRFAFTTSESSARRALTVLSGRAIGKSVITVRMENPD